MATFMKWYYYLIGFFILLMGIMFPTEDKPIYAELSYHNVTGITVTIPTTGSYYDVKNLTPGHMNLISYIDDYAMKIKYPGYYNMFVSFSFSGGANNEYNVVISRNNKTLDHCHARRIISTGGDIGNMAVSCIEYLTINDIVNIQIEDEADPTTDIVMHDMNFNIHLI